MSCKSLTGATALLVAAGLFSATWPTFGHPYIIQNYLFGKVVSGLEVPEIERPGGLEPGPYVWRYRLNDDICRRLASGYGCKRIGVRHYGGFRCISFEKPDWCYIAKTGDGDDEAVAIIMGNRLAIFR